MLAGDGKASLRNTCRDVLSLKEQSNIYTLVFALRRSFHSVIKVISDLSLVQTGLEFPFRPPSGHPQSGFLPAFSHLQQINILFPIKY